MHRNAGGDEVLAIHRRKAAIEMSKNTNAHNVVMR
jgi:hypothetical protein